jgi:hypothetical protein
MAFHIDGQWMWGVQEKASFHKAELLRSMLIAFAHGAPGRYVQFELQNDSSAVRIRFLHKGQKYMAHCQKSGSEEVTHIKIQRANDRSSVLPELNKASGACEDRVSVPQKRGANQLQMQWMLGKCPRPEPSGSGEMAAPQREPVLEQPPSPGEPAQAGTPEIDEFVKATYNRITANNLWHKGKEARQPELKHCGYEKAEGIKAVSRACDTVSGEYLGNGIYIHRGVSLQHEQTATVLRRLDEANGYQLRDLRIVIPASAPGTDWNTEASVLEEMQKSINRRNAMLEMLADKSEEPPRYRFALHEQMLEYWQKHREDFEALGFKGSSTLNRLLRLCQDAQEVRDWQDGTKLIPIDTPDGKGAELLWRVKGGHTTVLRVVPPDQDADTFRQHVLKRDDHGMRIQAGKRAKRLPEVTTIDGNDVRRILDRHGPQLAGIIGKTADRDAIRLISLLCDRLIVSDSTRCTELGDGITYFRIPSQANGLNEDAHVLRWVRDGKVIELMPCSTDKPQEPLDADKLQKPLNALRSFMKNSEARRKGRARAKAARLESQVSGAENQAA